MTRRRTDWFVKVRRYDGSTSVLAIWDNQAKAEADAALRNVNEQSGNHYAERYDPDLAWQWPRHGRRNSLSASSRVGDAIRQPETENE